MEDNCPVPKSSLLLRTAASSVLRAASDAMRYPVSEKKTNSQKVNFRRHRPQSTIFRAGVGVHKKLGCSNDCQQN